MLAQWFSGEQRILLWFWCAFITFHKVSNGTEIHRCPCEWLNFISMELWSTRSSGSKSTSTSFTWSIIYGVQKYKDYWECSCFKREATTLWDMLHTERESQYGPSSTDFCFIMGVLMSRGQWFAFCCTRKVLRSMEPNALKLQSIITQSNRFRTKNESFLDFL